MIKHIILIWIKFTDLCDPRAGVAARCPVTVHIVQVKCKCKVQGGEKKKRRKGNGSKSVLFDWSLYI